MSDLFGPLDEWLDRRLRIDCRALAVFRVAIAGLLLLDLALRLPDLVAFHTDRGVLPRSALAEAFPVLRYVSVHALSGSATVQAALFAVSGGFAVLLGVGYRTKGAAVVSWLLLASLQARNPVILNGGDLMLLALLFFGLFLPLGARYSVDAIREGKRTGTVAGIRAEAPLLYVVGLVYLVNAISRTTGSAWIEGTALQQVYRIDTLTRPTGEFLAQYPDLLAVLTWWWFGLLAVSPLLLLTTGRRRTILVAAFAVGHIGIMGTLDLLLFPLVNVVALVLFVPPVVWETIERRVPSSATVTIAGTVPTVLRAPPEHSMPDELQSYWTLLATTVLTAVLLVGFFWAFVAVAPPVVADSTGLNQGAPTDSVSEFPWVVFSPDPLALDGRYVTTATLETGERVDVVYGGPGESAAPPGGFDSYPRTRWTHYLFANTNRLYTAEEPVQDGFANYLCHRAADQHDASVESVEVSFVANPVDGAPERRFLTERSC